jgi:hypothetical protein
MNARELGILCALDKLVGDQPLAPDRDEEISKTMGQIGMDRPLPRATGN